MKTTASGALAGPSVISSWCNPTPPLHQGPGVPGVVRGQRQTFDDPGYPECWNLVSAYIRGWDCYRMLSFEQIAEIEKLIEERA